MRAGVVLSLRTVRTRRHKLTVDLRSGTGELYDLENDPDETNNLFDEPEAANLRGEPERRISTRPDDMKGLQKQVGLA